MSYRFPKTDHIISNQAIKSTWIEFRPKSVSSTTQSGDTIAVPASESVLLYCPMSVAFNDNAIFNNIDLGAMGGIAQQMSNIVSGEGDANSKMKSTLSLLGNEASTAWQEKVGLFTALQPTGNSLVDLAKLESKRVVNPHTNTLFEKVSVRKFSFSFKLIASSADEANEIKNIVSFFRTRLYPESIKGSDQASGFLLKFPPSWNISFKYGSGDSLSDNTFIPPIHECMMESFSSVYNSDANSWHSDGAPFDVSCQITFAETKAYDSQTIDSFEYSSEYGFEDGSEYGFEDPVDIIDPAIEVPSIEIPAIEIPAIEITT